MPNLLIIGHTWPEPDATAAGTRMLQLIEFFSGNGYSVVFATAAEKPLHGINLKDIGVETQKIKLNHTDFDVFIQKIQPDVVLFDRYMTEEQFGWRVWENCPSAMRILDTEDLHFLREARKVIINKEISLSSALKASETAKREIASIYRCDLSLIISEAEMELLQNEFGVPLSLLLYLPFSVDTPDLLSLPSFEEREHFLSIGNFRHQPNWDAVLNLKENIWPLIRKKLPDAELHVYGGYPPKKAFDLNDPGTGFIVKGRADSAEEVFRTSRVLISPLRFGAGLKGKFFDAMKYGTPAVTTSIGAEGINRELPWNGLIENDPEKFALAAVDIYCKKELWERSRQNGFTILRKRFDKGKTEECLKKSLSEMKKNLKERRGENFVGGMLLHHTINATRYLSKYLEAKNKNRD